MAGRYKIMATWATITTKQGNTRKPFTVRYKHGDENVHEKSFRTKKEVTDFQAEIRYRAARGSWIDPAHTRQTFHDAAEHWIGIHVGAENTRRIYRSLLRNHLDPAIGQVPMDKLARDRAGVQRLLLETLPANGLGRGSIGTAYTLITATIREAIANGRLAQYFCKLPW